MQLIKEKMKHNVKENIKENIRKYKTCMFARFFDSFQLLKEIDAVLSSFGRLSFVFVKTTHATPHNEKIRSLWNQIEVLLKYSFRLIKQN